MSVFAPAGQFNQTCQEERDKNRFAGLNFSIYHAVFLAFTSTKASSAFLVACHGQGPMFAGSPVRCYTATRLLVSIFSQDCLPCPELQLRPQKGRYRRNYFESGLRDYGLVFGCAGILRVASVALHKPGKNTFLNYQEYLGSCMASFLRSS